MRTRFCETIFWGKDSQNLGYRFLKFGGISLLGFRAQEGSGKECARGVLGWKILNANDYYESLVKIFLYILLTYIPPTK